MPILEVRVFGARNLPNPDRIGLPRTYCEVTVENIKLKTQPKERALSPEWDEVFKFHVSDAQSSQIRFRIKGENSILSDDFIGEYYLSINSLYRGVPLDEWVLLQGTKQNHTGNTELHIRVCATDFGEFPPSPPPPPQVAAQPNFSQQQMQQPNYPPPPMYQAPPLHPGGTSMQTFECVRVITQQQVPPGFAPMPQQYGYSQQQLQQPNYPPQQQQQQYHPYQPQQPIFVPQQIVAPQLQQQQQQAQIKPPMVPQQQQQQPQQTADPVPNTENQRPIEVGPAANPPMYTVTTPVTPHDDSHV